MGMIEKLILLFVVISLIVAFFTGVLYELITAIMISAVAVSVIVIGFLFWAHVIEGVILRKKDL